jgi:hypothetical protein
MERVNRLFVRDLLAQGKLKIGVRGVTETEGASTENDPNIGSARNTSTKSFLTTLAVNSAIFVVITCLFFSLRRQNRRIYAPLTCVSINSERVICRADG